MKNTEGFTLIELLVVVVIIGILAAIATPTFLNQTAKAKQSEAKSSIGSINSAQNAYRTEHSSFAASLDDLALGLPSSTNNYTYSLSGATDTATILATPSDTSLKGYAGGSVRFENSSSQSAIASIICESIVTGTSAPALPTLDPANSGNAASCPSTEVKL